MDGALPLLLLMGFLFGAMVLMLAMGIRWREWEEDEAEPEPEGDRAAVRAPPLGSARFFANVETHPLLGPIAMSDSTSAGDLEAQLESYIQKEHETVAEFAASPSLEELFRPTEFVGFETHGRGN